MSKKKQSVKGGSRALLLLVVILIGTNAATVYYFTVMNQSNVLEIGDITGDTIAQYIGQTVTVEGYLVVAGEFAILVTHPQNFWTDQLTSSNHLLITGVSTSAVSSSAGLWISLTGPIQYEDEEEGFLKIEYQSHQVLQSDAVPLPGCNESIFSTPINPGEVVTYVDQNPTKYAVLFSGGYNNWYAYSRYWNHITWFYVLLLLNGYDPDNIFVLYNNGTGDESNIHVDYPGTSDGMNQTFTYLASVMDSSDSLFVYVTDHGDEAGIVTWDEYDEDGIGYTEMLGWLDAITCHHMILILQECFSGAFVPYLSLSNRIIITACSANEVAWASDAAGFSEFTFRILCAFYGYHIWGYSTPIWADINNDGEISIAEAFGYAATMDSKDETPLYDDNGDQRGSTVGSIVGTDGIFGSGIFL